MRLQGLKLPSDAGQRLFPQVIDELAEIYPDRVLYEFAKGNKVCEGFRKVTCQEYTNAINRLAWFLDQQLGQSPRGEVIGYVGPGEDV